MYDSTLKNNLSGVVITATSNEPNVNRLIIKNSIFKTTEYLYDINAYPKRFISSMNAKDLSVSYTNFINDASFSNPAADIIEETRGVGIYSFNSNLQAVNNTIENLYSGVQIVGAFGAYNTIDVKNNGFTNNFNSISLNNINAATVTSNDIQIFDFSAYNNSYACGSSGIYILDSYGFHIEDNEIYSDTPTACSNGIFIRDCSNSNTIYRNRFSWLDTAIYAMGNNTYANTDEGLEIQCNSFLENATDVYVAPRSTIATLQGGKKTSAGNTFNPVCEGGMNEFNNQSGHQILYFGEQGAQYNPYCNNNLVLFDFSNHNECPSLLDGSSINLVALRNEINTNRTTLNTITDGGDTEGLTETVDETETSDAIILRNKLLQKSPFLSDTVMVKSATKENILPAIMLKQVLAANPKAAKSDKVQKALDDRANQLPEYMRYEIDLGKHVLSYKEELESNLSHDVNLKENVIDNKINTFLKDTINPSVSSAALESILVNESQSKLSRNYELFNYYLSKNDIQNAQNSFNDIENNFTLTEIQQEKYDKISQLFDIKKNLVNNNKSWYSLNDNQLAIVHNLALDSISTAGLQARAVLTLIEDADYGFPIPEKVNLNQNAYRAAHEVSPKFAVEPQKAINYFVIDYVLDSREDVDNVKFVIYDNLKNLVTSKLVKTNANQLIVECDKWQEGVYWCEKIVSGLKVEKKQILILRDKSFEDISNLMSIYPNPTSKYFNIRFGDTNLNGTIIQITDVKGTIIKTMNSSEFNKEIKIDGSSWQKGIYFVSLVNNKKIVETIKLIVE